MSVDSPPAQPQTSPSLIGQIIDGRYRITRKLGEGGMGEVFAAEHIHIEKRFAIKLLRPEIVSNAEAVTRFRQEARSSSSIGHRNIIAIEDFGQLSDGRIYMCMELLNGSALNDMITQPMGVDRLLNILIQTGHGLAAAHAKGIVHRDMKPENVFVTVGPNGEDIPKLLDFGIAKVSGNDGENHLTRTGTIFGTPFYMAPEQALGNPVDARTDIYAVGVIMYECFAGSLPFQGDSFMGILTQHITTEPEPVAQRAARAGRQLPAGLADVITCCMQKNPAQRFSTMDELVNVLVRIYRSILGPGMSSYMEAFPVLPSSAHQVQATPTPLTGPHMVSNPHAGTIVASGPSGPHIVAASASGVYGAAPQKSKLGLIIAVLVVLAIGGGVAAFVVVNNKGGGKGGGSGSEVAIKDHGSDDQGSDGRGSDLIAIHDGSAKDGSASGKDVLHDGSGKDLEHDGSGKDVGHDGSGKDVGHDGSGKDVRHDGSGQDATTHDGSGTIHEPDGSNTPPSVEVVPVLLSADNVTRFGVFENGNKLFDGPEILDVPRGRTRTVVIKAPGFKPKTLVVASASRNVRFTLSPIAGVKPNYGSASGSNHVTPPPPAVNCTNAIVDPKSKACVDQFCAAHPENQIKCHLE